jgi:hypothetical protein
MARELPQMGIRTTIVAGDYDSFKAALTRSIVGVTFKKFKKLGPRFYATKADNLAIVDATCRSLYEQLQKELEDKGIPLKHLRVSTSLKLKWDKDGRIADLSDVRVGVFQPIGELSVKSAGIERKTDKIRLDLYYSPVDFRSQAIRKELDELVNQFGKEVLQREDHDYLQPEEKRDAEKMGVKFVPAVVINREDVVDDPSRATLSSKINEYLSFDVKSIDARFISEVTLAPISQQLVKFKTE